MSTLLVELGSGFCKNKFSQYSYGIHMYMHKQCIKINMQYNEPSSLFIRTSYLFLFHTWSIYFRNNYHLQMVSVM